MTIHDLHEARVAHLAKALPEIAAGIAGAMETLSQNPTAWGAEEMAIRLEGARQHLLRLREALLSIAA